MIIIKTPDELERMRVSGRIAGAVRKAVAEKIAPGVTTQDLDDYAAELIREHGGKSCFLGYKGYPGHVCVSVNDEVVHGIPGPRRIELGDIVSVDVGVEYDGFIGDNAVTVMVGVTDQEIIRLINVTQKALDAAIEKAVVGNRLSDISHAVETVVEASGFTVVRDFVGHGVGRSLHEDPQVPNFGPPGKGPKLRPGMTLALEPMVNMGTPEVELMEDGWTVLTRDRRPSAHFEHTIAVGEESAEILTWTEEKR